MSECTECNLKKEVDSKYWVENNLYQNIRNLNNGLNELDHKNDCENYEKFIEVMKNVTEDKELMKIYEISNYAKPKYISYEKYLLKASNDAELVYNYFEELNRNTSCNIIEKKIYKMFIDQMKKLDKDIYYKTIIKHISMCIQKRGVFVDK